MPRTPTPRLPIWLRRDKDLTGLRAVRLRLRRSALATVCEEARCPNIAECFARHDATFLILGDCCTRDCAFCGVRTGIPAAPAADEPAQVARAAHDLGLRHVIITSVTRDDLPDQGAQAFADTIHALRRTIPGVRVEVLTPDFSGNRAHLETVLAAAPDVFGHNVETVARLYPRVRPQADLQRSLTVLAQAKTSSQMPRVKSGFMVGLGESEAEIEGLLVMLRDAGVDMLTIGQYLQPSRRQIAVQRYWEPERFEDWAGLAKALGIRYVQAGPLVRSSYRAEAAWEEETPR